MRTNMLAHIECFVCLHTYVCLFVFQLSVFIKMFTVSAALSVLSSIATNQKLPYRIIHVMTVKVFTKIDAINR